MKLSLVLMYGVAIVVALYPLSTHDTKALSLPGSNSSTNIPEDSTISPASELEKRKGGGGRGGGGGGGKSGGEKSPGGGTPNSKSNSNAGGKTVSGSGVRPNYGGGRYYGGGATVPYTAGNRSPLGLAPLFILPLAALAIFPGLWLYGVYQYPYTHPYTFVNQTITNATFPNGINQTLPIDCLCQQYSVCGCDDNSDSIYLHDLIRNGSYSTLNKTLVTISIANGTQTIVINGTLPNGTTAAGGTISAAARQGAFGYGVWKVLFIFPACFLFFAAVSACVFSA